MNDLIELVLTGENLRTLLLLVAIVGGFLLQNARMDKRFVEVRSELKADIARLDKDFVELRSELKAEIAAVRNELGAEIAAVRNELGAEIAGVRNELGAEIAGVRGEILHLKDNDFGHLNNAFKNLTYVLEKKRLIDAEDKAFIDQALDG